jgi:hypothetical protein
MIEAIGNGVSALCTDPESICTMSTLPNERTTSMIHEPRDDAESWPEWYAMTPLERWRESAVLWQFYLEAGGSLDPEPDSQSPFDAVMQHGTAPAYGRPGLRVLRRSGV